jgi:hypothetical protein
VVRRAIEDHDFAAVFEDEARITERWPTRVAGARRSRRPSDQLTGRVGEQAIAAQTLGGAGAVSSVTATSPRRSPVLRRREHECDRASRRREPLPAGRSAPPGAPAADSSHGQMRLRRVVDARGPVTREAVMRAPRLL